MSVLSVAKIECRHVLAGQRIWILAPLLILLTIQQIIAHRTAALIRTLGPETSLRLLT